MKKNSITTTQTEATTNNTYEKRCAKIQTSAYTTTAAAFATIAATLAASVFADAIIKPIIAAGLSRSRCSESFPAMTEEEEVSAE